jgi:hypothetical protein
MATTNVLTAAGVSDWHPTRDRLWRGGALLLLPLLAFALAIPFISATDPDYWWHLRTGQLILDTGAIPTVDDYSFTVTGQPWIAHEWLSELLIGLLARGTGYVGVAFAFGVVCAATLGLVYATGRARGASPTTMALCCAWAMLMLQPSVNVRPQLFTMLLLALFAFLLTRYRAGASRALWPLPALTVLWVNLHGGYLIGLVLLGLTLVGESGAAALGHRAAPWRPLLVTLILAALGSLLTPHGLDAVRYPLSYLGRENASLQFVAEWRSPDFHQPLFMPFAASLLLGLTLGLANRPPNPTDSLWTLAVTFMALQSVRHIPLYAIIVTPLLAARLAAPLRAGWSPPARIRNLGRALAGALAVALPLLLLGVGWQLASAPGGTRQLGVAANPNGYPVGGSRSSAPCRARHGSSTSIAGGAI